MSKNDSLFCSTYIRILCFVHQVKPRVYNIKGECPTSDTPCTKSLRSLIKSMPLLFIGIDC